MCHNDLVLVTGATGFIAAHIIKLLQENGYRVRGTVRNLQNTERLQPLYDLCPDAQHKLELVEADLLKPDTWPAAVAGCKYVMHVASPLQIAEPKNPDDVIVPAREGTRAVLEACRGTSVRRVVMTSSCAAIKNGRHKEVDFTEDDWGDPDNGGAYSRSKVQAERLAWDLVSGLPQAEKFELATINPGMVGGPPLLKNASVASIRFFQQILEGRVPMIPYSSAEVVDVRDVAQAHLAAMTSPHAAGHRHIVTENTYWFSDIAAMLRTEFGPLGYSPPWLTAPNWLVRVMGLFSVTSQRIAARLNHHYTFDNSRMREVLGVQPRKTAVTLRDMGHKCIELGYIRKTRAYQAKVKERDTVVTKADWVNVFEWEH